MPLFERELRVCYGKPIRQVLEQYRKELEEEELQNKETVVQPETEIASFFGISRTSLWRTIGKT